jgi:2-oxoglutarate ferredoxin oxidoreductase subunit alpha
MDYTIKIGGEAGQGIQTVGDSLSKVFSRSGYHVFTHQDYESRVRGGHNFFQIRLADGPVTCSRDGIDILVAFDGESVERHRGELVAGGVIVYDPALTGTSYEGTSFLEIPFVDLAQGVGGTKVMANTVATGAVLGMLGLKLSPFFQILRETLAKKGEAVVEANRRAAEEGSRVAVERCLRCSFTAAPAGVPKLLTGVNEMVGLGALVSGCRFYSAYPMTPSTGVMLYLAGKAREFGVVVEQAEDEISAINMALGASFAGVRSMTGTSGGGFALMVEGLSLAAMTETPIVILLAQRPGPATGLPTRTEQADLLFALYSAHGEFPRILFAPGTPDEAFYMTNKAFDLSQKYQVPAFILTDQYLSDTQWTMEGVDLERVVYRDYRVRGEALSALTGYKRHALTIDGVSPFAVPGESRHLVVTDSDEHDEEGHLVEDGETRKAMVDKRLFRKLPRLRREMSQPTLYGHDDPALLLVGWGSTFGLLKEAVDALSPMMKAAVLHFGEIYPLPEPAFLEILRKAPLTIGVEQNATSQFAALLKAETGFTFHRHMNRCDGRPWTRESFLEELHGHLG